jgi:hypothetical protein
MAAIVLVASVTGSASANANTGEACLDMTEVQLCSSDSNFLTFSGGYALEIPGTGQSLILTADKTDGTSISIKATTSAIGDTVATVEQYLLSTGKTTSSTVLPQNNLNCGSGTYFTQATSRATQPFHWWYNKTYEPASNSIYRITKAFNTWEMGKNRCNATIISNSFSSIYEGLTTDTPHMQNVYTNDSSGHSVVMCGVQTSKHILFWAWLDTDILAVTCTTLTTQGSGHSSVRINSDLPWYTTLDMSFCDSKFDLKGAITHEVGHVLGLDHFNHVGQTMRPSGSQCDMNMRGLGYGDVHGAATVFPPN